MRQASLSRLGAVLFLGAAVLFASGAPAAAKKARAVFKETAHDFGKVKQGEVLVHEFVFKNEGDEPLVVERVETTCGCTAALLSAQRIEPGQEGRVKTTFDTRGYQGRVTRYVILVSNDADKKRRELALSVDIEVPPSARIDLDAYNIDLGLSLEGESPSAKIKVKSVGERELQVDMSHEEIGFFSGGKAVSFPLRIKPGDSREIELRFAPQARTGSLRDYVLIKSNDPVRSVWSVYISRYVITRKELRDLFERYRSVLEGRR